MDLGWEGSTEEAQIHPGQPTVKVTGHWPRQGGCETARLRAQRYGTVWFHVAYLICPHIYGTLKHVPVMLQSFGLGD